MKLLSSNILGSISELCKVKFSVFAVVLMILMTPLATAADFGYVWLADKEKVLVKINAETGVVELEIPLIDKKVEHLAVDDKRKVIWLAAEHGPLYAYDYAGVLTTTLNLNDILTQVTTSQKEKDDDDDEFEIETLIVDKRDGSIWVALEHKLVKINQTGEMLLSLNLNKHAEKLELDIADNSLWVFDEKSVYSIDTETGLVKTTLLLPAKKEGDDDDDDHNSLKVKDISFDQHLQQLWVAGKNQLLRYQRDGSLVLDLKIIDPLAKSDDEDKDDDEKKDDDKKDKDDDKDDSDEVKIHYIKHLEQITSDGRGNVWLAAKKNIYRIDTTGLVNLSLTPDSKKHQHDEHRKFMANVNDHSVWLINKKYITHILIDGTQAPVETDKKHIESVTLNGDINAPILTLVSPIDDDLVSRRPELKLTFNEVGVGVHIPSIKLLVNDTEVPVTCNGDLVQATCTPNQDLLAETLVLTLTVEDRALNLSNTVTATVKLDSDGDGVPDYKDTYPEDPTRWRLAAVTGAQTALDLKSIKLNWAEHIDPPKTKGYVVYRTEFGQAESKITPEPLTSLEYTDSTVTNGTGYSYRVVAVDNRDYEGEPGTINNFFVAYNYIPVTNFSAVRNPVAALLNWQNEAGKRYQLYRGLAATATQPIITFPENTTTYVDDVTLWNLAYYYQISTLADFTDVFTNQAVIVEGPLSSLVELPALPPLDIKVYDAYPIADNSVELTLVDPDTMSITGKYTEAVGPVIITATAADNTTLTQERSDNKFNLLLPVAKGLSWTLSVSELTVPDRTTTINLTLKEDKEAPVITIDGETNRTVDAELITVAGTAADVGIGIKEVYLANSRYANQEFGSILSADNFSSEIPLQSGENVITVTAVDRMGNTATAQITVTLRATVLPKVSILSPQTGSVFYDNSITVTGEVYTSQAADQIKITLGNQEIFPTQSISLDTYSYTFTNVRLNEGFNPVNVRVDTPAGSAETNVIVSYSTTPPQPDVTPAPYINLTSPRETSFLNATSVIIAGDINSQAGISSVTIAGQSVALVGQTVNYKTFQYEYSLLGIEGQVTVDIVVTDILNQTTKKTITLSNDTQAPVITITTPNISIAPLVNAINEMPYKLQGTVSDLNLAGFSINGTAVSLLPSTTAGSYEFAVDLNLPTGAGQIVSLEARDAAGNLSSQELIFDVTLPVQIEIISPRDKSEVASGASGTNIDVVARLIGMEVGYTANLIFNADAAVAMNRDGNVANLGIQTALNSGDQSITVQILDAAQQVISSRSVSITLKNIENIPLAVERTEPANDDKNINPNERINVYFNQAIDPALLQIQVHETVHGKTYDLSQQKGKGMGEISLPDVIDINRDMEPLVGTLSQFPGNRYTSYNPAERYNYGATIFVTVIYDGNELNRFSFKVKDVPTIISGMVRDQLGEAIEGIEVTIPEFKLSGLTDEKGNFNLRSENAGKPLKAGRYSVIYNPDMAKAIYGTAENEFSVQLGNINTVRTQIVSLLNPGIAFSYIRSGQNPAVLNSGNLELDLTDATLTFANGRDSGNLHSQFAKISEIAAPTIKEASPYWMYTVQPAGVEVAGKVGVKIQMPILFGSHDYVPENGTLVVMLGFNNDTRLIEPVGVGRIENNVVTSVNKLTIQTMDYFGYAMVATEHQPILQRFVSGETTLIEVFKSELVQAISN